MIQPFNDYFNEIQPPTRWINNIYHLQRCYRHDRIICLWRASIYTSSAISSPISNAWMIKVQQSMSYLFFQSSGLSGIICKQWPKWHHLQIFMYITELSWSHHSSMEGIARPKYRQNLSGDSDWIDYMMYSIRLLQDLLHWLYYSYWCVILLRSHTDSIDWRVKDMSHKTSTTTTVESSMSYYDY